MKTTATYNVRLYLVAFLLPIFVSLLLSKPLKAHPELHWSRFHLHNSNYNGPLQPQTWSVSSTMDIINQNWSSQSEIEFGSFWNECVPRSLYMCTQQFAHCTLNGHVTLLHPLTEILDPHLNNPFKPTVSISFCVRLLWYLLNCLFKESHHGAHPAIVHSSGSRRGAEGAMPPPQPCTNKS